MSAPTNIQVRTDSTSQWTVHWQHDNGGVEIDEYCVRRLLVDDNNTDRQRVGIECSKEKWLTFSVIDPGVNDRTSGFIRGYGYDIQVYAAFFCAELPPPRRCTSRRSDPIFFGAPPPPAVEAIWNANDPYHLLVRWRSTANSGRGGSPITWEPAVFVEGVQNPQRRAREFLWETVDRSREAVLLLAPGQHTWTVTVRGKNAAGWGPVGRTTVTTTVPSGPTIPQHEIQFTWDRGNAAHRLKGPTVIRPGVSAEYRIVSAGRFYTYANALGIIEFRNDGAVGLRVGDRRNDCRNGTEYFACMVTPERGDTKSHGIYSMARQFGPHLHEGVVTVAASGDGAHVGKTFRIGPGPWVSGGSGTEHGTRAVFEAHCHHQDFCTTEDRHNRRVDDAGNYSFEVRIGYYDEKPLPPTIGISTESGLSSELIWQFSDNWAEVGLSEAQMDMLELRQSGGSLTTHSHSQGDGWLRGRMVLAHSDYRARAPMRIRVRGIAHPSMAHAYKFGPWSESVLFGGAPPPEFLRATPGDGQVQLEWGLPTLPEDALIIAPTGYVILYSTDELPMFSFGNISATGVDSIEVDSTATTHVVRGLPNDRTHYFTMRAKGPGRYRSISSTQVQVTPAENAGSAPSAPLELVATARADGVDLAWQPPADDGLSPHSGYQVQYTVDSADRNSWQDLVANTGDSSTEYRAQCNAIIRATVPYYFRVRAINRIGTSAASAVATATITGCPPTAPVGLTAQMITVDQAELRWHAPEDNGGSAITAYRIERRPVGATVFDAEPRLAETAGHLTTRYIDRTPPGSTVDYEYVVIAFNALGGGLRSAVVAGDRSAPVSVRAEVRSDRWVRVEWAPPINQVLDPVDQYRGQRLTTDETWVAFADDLPATVDAQLVLNDRTVVDARQQVHTYRVVALREQEDQIVIPAASVAVHTDPTAPLMQLPEIDLNGDHVVSVEDALIMYYHLTVPGLVVDESAAPAAQATAQKRRKTFLSRLTLDATPPNDGTLQGWLDKAARWETVGPDLGGDLDGSGTGGGDRITENDARILYYTFTFPELLGTGLANLASDHIRMVLIGSLLDTGNTATVDARSRDAISAAYELIRR